MDGENFVALIISVLIGAYLLYCLFRPEDL
jgi:K+-transporting ATPase KdpF subunit